MASDQEPLPPRLIDGDADTAAATLLKKFERIATPLPSQAAVWDRTLSRMARNAVRNRLSLGLAAACGIFAGAVGLHLVVSLRRSPASFVAVGAVVDVAGQADKARTNSTPRATTKGTMLSGEPDVRTPASPASLAAPSVVAPSVSARHSPRIELGGSVVGLPFGPSELVGEAEAVLSRDGKAGAFVEARAATIALAAGAIDLHVEKRDGKTDHKFQVLAGSYRFTVLGTRFQVTRIGRVVKLAVREGRVEVTRGERVVAVIGGGENWSSSNDEAVSRAADRDLVAVPSEKPPARQTARKPPDGGSAVVGAPPPFIAPATPSTRLVTGSSPPEPLARLAPQATIPTTPGAKWLEALRGPPIPRTHSVSPAGARMAPPSDCGMHAETDARRGLECYLLEARGDGLAAEIGLYEAARLRRDALNDPAGALESLTEHRRRFPSGNLKFEVDLSIAELLPDLGRYREALIDIESLLKSSSNVERRGELLLLRGHVLREGFHDWAGAERAYAGAVESADTKGRAADAAAFWRAVCLEAMGRRDEAKRAYTSYLARSRPLQAAEAARRLKALLR
ncbi:MAG: FecR domain-containing protein [Myxococcales bacterium]